MKDGWFTSYEKGTSRFCPPRGSTTDLAHNGRTPVPPPD